MPATSSLPEWFNHAIEALHAGDTDAYCEMYAPDAVHEFPFTRDGVVRRLEGRDAIAAYMSQIPSRVKFGALTDVRVREVGDELIAEATGHHQTVPEGKERELNYIWFITHRNGKVTHFRDYMNPLQLSAR
jgi:uncharacterized protein